MGYVKPEFEHNVVIDILSEYDLDVLFHLDVDNKKRHMTSGDVILNFLKLNFN